MVALEEKRNAREKTPFDLKRALVVGLDATLALSGGKEAIGSRRRRRLEKILSFARERSPYYRKLYGALPDRITDLTRLPPTDKAELMENFDEWVTDPRITLKKVEEHLKDESLLGKPLEGKYLAWTSSGISGIPAAFVQDGEALAVMAAMGVFRGPAGLYDVFRTTLHGNRQAGIYGTYGHLHGAAMMEHMRSSGPGRAERFLGLSVLTPLPEMVRRLNDFQPAMFWCFASTLLLLAEEQEAGRLHIDPVLILSGGERLSERDRQRMTRAFGCPVRDYYGTAEAAGLSYDCEEGWLHLNADWFVLEAVDENHQPTPPGETSHTVLLTNLANRLQPLIRYDLGDRISFKEGPCPCGSPLPAFWVEGRRNELLSFPADDDRGEVKLPPRALSTVIDFAPGVRRCQAIKSSPRSLKVRIEVEGGREEGEVWKEVRRRLKGYLSTQGLSKVGVELDSEKPSIDERTGKFRHVWSEVEGEGVGAEAIRW